MTRPLAFAVALSVCSAAAAIAQEPPPAVPPPPATQPATTPPAPTAPPQDPLPAVSTAPVASPIIKPAPDGEAYKRRRREIEIVEGVLVGAVRGAALEMAKVLDMPGTGGYNLSGSWSARGFILDGYGVFFHVEIPGVTPTIVPLEVVRRMQPRPEGQPQPTSTADAGRVVPPPSGSDADYVERVTNALIDAMIKYSMPLELDPNEWFIVAASDGDLPVTPAFLVPRSTMILRLRGSDIADYMAKRLTLEEVRKKVDVRKF